MIGHFTGDYAFLSNFYVAPIRIDVYTFPTVEHFYQASKAATREEFHLVLACKTAAEAKRVGRRVRMSQTFEQDKKLVMQDGVMRKFQQHPDLRHKLIATGTENLVELNTWGDDYWGAIPARAVTDAWRGENWLGRILMMAREILA